MRNLKVLLAASLIWFCVGNAARANASEPDQRISVSRAKASGRVVRVDAELNGQKMELTCFTSENTCKSPANGQYIMRPARDDDEVYQDCPNVALFEIGANGTAAMRIGIYCRLQ